METSVKQDSTQVLFILDRSYNLTLHIKSLYKCYMTQSRIDGNLINHFAILTDDFVILFQKVDEYMP
jgi:hypothetical protein